ncbi:MAG: cation transporter, partial [Staphylococcus simulans]|nr:cation transporter [Staphylococcus simulans]
MEKAEFKISGMTCAACSSRIERVLSRTEGIDQANVNLVTEKASIEYDQSHVDMDQVFEKVKQLGYEPIALETADEAKARKNQELNRQKMKFIIAMILSLP